MPSKRKLAHSQKKETLMEYLFRFLRLRNIYKHIPKNCTITDLGCGFEGKLLKDLSAHVKKGVGVDINVNSANLPGNITLIPYDLEKKLSLKDNTFDVVLSTAVIEHLNNPNILISEAYRILKKNGFLLITTPNARYSFILESLAYLKLISKEEIKDHKRYYNQKSLHQALRIAGFSKNNISIRNVQFPGFNLLAKAIK